MNNRSLISKLLKKKNKKRTVNNINLSKEQTPLKSKLSENLEFMKTTLGESSDIIFREFRLSDSAKTKLAVVHTDGLSDRDTIQEQILKTLMVDIRKLNFESEINSKKKLLEFINNYALPGSDVKEIEHYELLYNLLLSGDTIILIDGYKQAFVVSTRAWSDRGITAPDSQTVVRGPKDSFTETLRTNTSLLRRKIKDPNLWIETTQIGRKTKTDVSIAYINGVADEKIVEEVRERLERIDIDGILEGGYIEEFIQDKTFTPFPTVYNSERPDAIAAGLLEGRVAIIVDGTPFVLLVPALFIHFLQSAEDYFQRFDISTLSRILRYIAFFLALLTPSLYIAITTFHQEMIPTTLLVSIAAQRDGVPFPALVEALIMELTFEILREAGIRMPRSIGAAISIVGALVLGEAAVQAGIVSPVMVIVVSITAISSFVIPSYNMANSVRILRFGFMLASATFGLYGMAMCFIALLIHLCSLRSFSVPYMIPLAPFNTSDQKDAILRFPIWSRWKSPRILGRNNSIRQQNPSKAKPEPNK